MPKVEKSNQGNSFSHLTRIQFHYPYPCTCYSFLNFIDIEPLTGLPLFSAAFYSEIGYVPGVRNSVSTLHLRVVCLFGIYEGLEIKIAL